ncbi:type II toxin-antitoxin system PemK/MazF family toxin [Bosea sp. AAP35]|uniref:type II toxin-antitoxin system PemK/MazF family toxin n=1 Tax=Bosea sp. AAP35 TaxID=1523417 RepID=UPI0009E9F28C|nr:type II toxin-antitoxin system PemK/MazF family toxin [Bosea sp. AAP35]
MKQPEPGLVIRFAYLWRSEAAVGRDEAAKDRPCAVVVATTRQDGNLTVYVAPITHTPPGNPLHAIEIPAGTKRRLGLDDARSWIVTTEVNGFTWPGPDLRPIGRGADRGFIYGPLPRSMTVDLVRAIREHIREGRAKIIGRDEKPVGGG